jgi:hypothetical protein
MREGRFANTVCDRGDTKLLIRVLILVRQGGLALRRRWIMLRGTMLHLIG